MASLRSPRIPLPLALALVLDVCPLASGKPSFNSSEIQSSGSDMLFCDLDGNGLKDLILVNWTNLAVFFQGPSSGPHAFVGAVAGSEFHFNLDDRPSLVSAA